MPRTWGSLAIERLKRRSILLAGGLSVVAFAAPRAMAGSPPAHAWPGGARAAVSLTYDDGLNSHLDHAIPQLDAAGLKATFFLTRDNMIDRLADWQAAQGRGHEIADHTVTHACRLTGYSAAGFVDREVAPMERFLNEKFGPARRLFAYPCDNTELGRGSRQAREARFEQVVSRHFAAARTTDGPPNDPRRVAANRFYLHGFEPTYDADTARLAKRYLNRAMASGGWAILIFHEILPRRLGEGDTSIRIHAEILRWIQEQPLHCAPFGEVLQTLLPDIHQAEGL